MTQVSKPIKLIGVLTQGEESRGKTLAAWNGIPIGHHVYYLDADDGQRLHPNATNRFMVRAKNQVQAAQFDGKRVVITGIWDVPATVPDHPEQPMQMPITSEPDGTHRVIQKQTVFVAERIVETD